MKKSTVNVLLYILLVAIALFGLYLLVLDFLFMMEDGIIAMQALAITGMLVVLSVIFFFASYLANRLSKH